MPHNNHGILRKNASSITLLQRLIDPLAVVSTLKMCTLLFGIVFHTSYIILSVVIVLLCIPIFKTVGLYQPYRHLSLANVTSRILLGWFCLLATLLFLGFASQETVRFSRPMLTLWAVTTPLGLTILHAMIWQAVRNIRRQGRNSRQAVIAGYNTSSQYLFEQIQQSPELGIAIQGFFVDPDQNPQTFPLSLHLLGQLSDLPAYVRQNQIDVVYLASPLTDQGKINQLLMGLQDTTACVYYVPNIFVFNLMQAKSYELGNIPLISIWEIPFSGIQSTLKRVMDVIVALVILILLSPAMLLMAFAVKISSPGPIFIKHKRYGLNGQDIIIYQFRTHRLAEVSRPRHSAPRQLGTVTGIGAFLERTSLHQLPQLFNVLQGYMSIVGPCPHAVVHHETYRKLISGYMLRHKVKPGITGWAQIHGLKGELETLDVMKQRVKYDLEYLRTWSLLLDLKIMCLSIGAFLGNSRVYQ